YLRPDAGRSQRPACRCRARGTQPDRAGRARGSSGRTTRGARAGLLRRIESIRDRRANRFAARHDQDTNATRAAETPRAVDAAARGRHMSREMTHDEAFASLDALALDALDGAERDSVVAHVSTCIPCREELASLRATAAQLAYAAAPTIGTAGARPAGNPPALRGGREGGEQTDPALPPREHHPPRAAAAAGGDAGARHAGL